MLFAALDVLERRGRPRLIGARYNQAEVNATGAAFLNDLLEVFAG